jgi:hypothetical protein
MAPFDGVVGRRGLSTFNAPTSRCFNRFSAASRLRSWDRSSDDAARTTSPSFSRSRARVDSVPALDALMSHVTSARVFDVLACWPPGPPDAVKRHSNSSSGMMSERVTTSPLGGGFGVVGVAMLLITPTRLGGQRASQWVFRGVISRVLSQVLSQVLSRWRSLADGSNLVRQYSGTGEVGGPLTW